MVTLIPSRGVDGAAGQLIVREAGGVVSFPDCDEPLGAPLDSTPVSHLVAARTERGLRELEAGRGVVKGLSSVTTALTRTVTPAAPSRRRRDRPMVRPSPSAQRRR